MVEDTSPASQISVARAARSESVVQVAAGFGVVLAFLGLLDGLHMVFKRHVADCPDGTEFPQGTTDFNCYVHPQAGVGIAIAVCSALLGLLVVFSAITAVAALRSAVR